jgi:hypothetical protein
VSGRAVFVLGMHRSGTSAVTRVVNLLGVPIAKEQKPADDANARGYWETPSLSRINEKLLNLFGGGWFAPPELDEGWEDDPRVAGLRGEARTRLARAHDTEEWVWKDPRNSLTLGFWLPLASVEPVVVLVHRDPAEVADSLRRRDGFAVPFSHALWERYNRAALAAAAGRPAFLIRYERLVETPAEVAAGLAAFLRGQGFAARAPSGEEVETFVDPALRRSRGIDGADGPSAAQRDLLAALASLEGAHELLPQPELPPETPWVEPLLDGRRRVLVLEAEQRRLRRELELIRRRTALGLELRVVQGSAGWRLLTPARRLASLRRRHASD